MLFRVPEQVQNVKRQTIKKLLLILRRAVSIGGWRPLLNAFGNAEIFCQLIHLGFEKVCDDLQINAPIAVLNKKAFVVFVFVCSSHHGELTSLSVIIERAHPRGADDAGPRPGCAQGCRKVS